VAVFLANAVLLLLYDVVFPKNETFACVLGGVQIFLLLALRADTYGADANYYRNGFSYIASLDFEHMAGALNPSLLNDADLVWPYSFENGWVVLNWLFAAAGLTYRSLVVALSAATAVSFTVFCRRYSKNPCYSLFLMSCLAFLPYAVFILRQTLAFCICLWAVPFALERKPGRFLLVVACAFLFHRSALLFLVLYPLAGLRATKRAVGWALAAFLGIALASATVLPYVLPALLSLVGKAHYSVGFAWNNMVALQFVLVAALLAFPVDAMCGDARVNLAVWGMLASLVTYGAMLNNEVLARANEYLWVFVVLLVPALLDELEPHEKTLGYLAASALALAYLCQQTTGGAGLDPYVFMF
jgi:hypothetical protein